MYGPYGPSRQERVNSAKKTSNEEPIDLLNMFSDLCYQEITHNMKSSIENCEFLDKLKGADA